MGAYDRFRKSNINLSPVGFEQRDTDIAYFCTPKGARILGWAGVDGIHYCFIRGFGEMVFAVSPGNEPGNFAHPIGADFEDLLRLLLACGDMAAIEQAHGWDRETFDAFLKEPETTPEQEEVLAELRTKLALTPMEDPFGYIKKLQAGFDYGRIKFTQEYYDTLPDAEPPKADAPWKVYFSGGGGDRQRPGREVPLDRRFAWGEERWRVPAYYSCGKGLVMDLCVEIEPERLRAFWAEWSFAAEDESVLTREQRDRMERENPLNVDFRPVLYLNGDKIHAGHGSGLHWIPETLLPDGTENPPEAAQILSHYGLDGTRGWSFWRWSFPWKTPRKPVVRTLRLKLERAPVSIDGVRFQNPSVGDVISFTHPVSGTEHRLKVKTCELLELSADRCGRGEYEIPRYHTAMTYTLEPDLPDNRFHVRDCLENDRPRPGPGVIPADASAACIGIIGGADGPTVIVLGTAKREGMHTAVSALHFAPTADVEWKMVFREKLTPDTEVELKK